MQANRNEQDTGRDTGKANQASDSGLSGPGGTGETLQGPSTGNALRSIEQSNGSERVDRILPVSSEVESNLEDTGPMELNGLLPTSTAVDPTRSLVMPFGTVSAIDDETSALAEAEIERRKAAGEKVDPANFRDDDEDPLDIDFAWASGRE